MSKVELYLDWNPFNGTEEEFLAVKEFKWKSWGENGKLHRIGGPARIWPDGAEEWRQNGFLHRTDGPARINRYGNSILVFPTYMLDVCISNKHTFR